MIRLAAILSILFFVIAQSEPTNAGTGEPKRWTRKVPKNSDVIYKIKFLGEKEVAEFAIIGDGSTDVDILVFDEAGKQVAVDDGNSDLAMVRWKCVKTQVYKIVVRNLGGEDNVCSMGHN
jgi:hypothetical protein